jgi:hypothetical protein
METTVSLVSAGKDQSENASFGIHNWSHSALVTAHERSLSACATNESRGAGRTRSLVADSQRKTKRMKRIIEKPNLVHNVGALNEEILEAADKIDGKSLAPEVSTGTAEMTVWDESPEDVGWRMHERPMENQLTIAEQLVSEGNEQADREQRMAADASDTAVAR